MPLDFSLVALAGTGSEGETRLWVEILSNVVDRIFEGGDPGGQVNEYGDLRRLRVSTGLEAILEADTRAH